MSSTDNPYSTNSLDQNGTTARPSSSAQSTMPNQQTTGAGEQTTHKLPTTVAAQQQQTTPSQVPLEPSNIEANTDIGPCTCDLTGNACDVNCCCDPDCSADDILTFSFCADEVANNEDRVCFSRETIYNVNNNEVKTEIVGGLFCIAVDNYEDRNYYTVPETVGSIERFDELVAEYGSYSFAKESEANETFDDYYQSGDKIYTLFEGSQGVALGYLGLPAGLVTNTCNDNNPARFLFDESTECVRVVTDLAAECESIPSLSSYSYHSEKKIIAAPANIRDMFLNVTNYNMTTVLPLTTNSVPINTTTIPYTTPSLYSGKEFVPIRFAEPAYCVDLFNIRTSCNISSVHIPIYDQNDGTCSNVVTEVHYTITHNSTNGIIDAEVLFVLSTVNSASFPILQKFSTTFVKLEEENPSPRSGNPGYIVGEPVVAGNRTSYQENTGSPEDEQVYTKYAISLSEDRYNRMTVVTSTAGGMCASDSDSRIPVVFGEDIRSGCLISVSFAEISDACMLISSMAKQALAGDMPEYMYVAMFGNSDVEIVGDWVPVIIQEPEGEATSTLPGQCDNVILSLNIEVLYANIGSLANPQAKIVGVKYTFIAGTLKYQCVGPYCQPGTENLEQKYEIASSVSFLDVSTYPDAVIAEIPPWKVELPNDFFYPLSSASSAGVNVSTIMLYVIINWLLSK
ncbi:tectonic-1-like isoform X2 [Anneissia japonica]|nr:tectonic-1-like isoform X2 [Anneissia japonica]